MDLQRQEMLVTKSNDFILAKQKVSGPLEAKLIAISLTRIQMVGDNPVAQITSSEIQRLLYGNTKDKNIYTKLKKLSADMTTHNILIENPKKKAFVSFSLITEARYENGTLEIKYNSSLAPYILDLKQNFTTYGIENILGLKSVYSLKLYEILRKEAYKITKTNPFTYVEYSVSELKALLGMLDMSESQMKLMRDKGASWEEIEAACKVQNIERYTNLRRRVLEKTREELTQSSDISFTYEPIRVGRGAKVKAIRFCVFWNNRENNSLPDELISYIGHNELTEDNLNTFLSDAENEVSKVLAAIAMADDENYIENYVGWIRSCIKQNWTTEKIETLKGSKEKADNARAIINKVEEEKKDPNSEMFIRMWDNMQKREDFGEYLSQLSEKERDYMEFLDYQTRVENFIEWRKKDFKN